MQKRKRKCPNCKQFFHPHPSTRHHQRYCSLAACQKARKKGDNVRFRKENPDYHKGPEQVDRVRQWRRQNPGYWRRERRNGGSGRKGVAQPTALQVVLEAEPLENQVVTLQGKVDALQAVSDRQDILFQGVASHLTGFALQAELQPVLDGWYRRGSQLSEKSSADENL